MAKKKLTDDELKIEMFQLWGTGERGKTNFYELLRTKFQLSKTRCLKIYDQIEQEASKTVLKAQSNTLISETEEAVKKGLKSDLELEMILCQIASGNVEVEEWIKGESVLRSVSPMEVINAAKVIFTKRGSNAPTKVAQTNAAGEDVPLNERVITFK